MKKFVNKLMAGMLAFAMTVSAPMSAMAAPENTETAPVSEGEITLSQEAETTLAAAKALSSLNENYGDSEDGQDNAKSAVKNAIFSNYNDSTDLSRYNISSDEMDSMLDEILVEKDITSTVAVTYETDAEGDVTTTEVEMDPMVVMAAEELEENKTVYNLTEEQTQELLGMYAQYLQLYQDNADMFGVQVPYNTTRDTNSSPIGSLLDVASIPEDYIEKGYVGYDVLSGIIQLYYLGTQFAVTEYKDEVIAGRDEALAAMAPATTSEMGTSEMQEYLLLNDWLANNCQFAMDYIMDEMVQPEPKANDLYLYAYNCMYNMIRQQVYDATYDVMVNQYGMPAEMAEEQANGVADAFMVDVQEDGGSGEQQAASTASAIVGMWGSNQVGVFVGKKAVCFGYATVYAYLLQCAHPEIYTKDGADINTASNWKSYTELNYELDGDGNPVQDENGDYVWSAEKSAAMVDYVKIIFDADATMFGETAPFGEAHYWNAVKLDGQWYYVDPCYVDIYVECMNRDRVETDGNLNHLYFMFSDDSCRDMYKDNFKEIRTLYEGIATDATYEDAWVAFIKSQPYKVNDRTYYFYDSTDLLDIMREYGNGSSSNSNSRAAGDDYSDYEGLFTDSEYKIVCHTDAQGDTSADFETLIDFNNGQVYNPESEMLEDNALISELYAEHQEYVKEYPSIMISCAYYEGKIYFSLSNCILSYDLESGAVTKLIEYTEVSGERDMSNGLGGLGFTMTSGDPGANGITVQNPPIADMTIKSDGKMYVSVATSYGFISGKDFGKLTDYSSYGYQFAESNYNPAYNTYYNNDEPNDNDEFMWSANIVGTIEMEHLAGTDHKYSDVTVPVSCTEDKYTVSRCSTCGLIEETVTAEESVQTVNDGEAESDPNEGEPTDPSEGESTDPSEGESTDPGEDEPADSEEPAWKDVATLVIEITTGEDGQTLAKAMLKESKTGETEGDSADFDREVIEAKANEVLPEGYTLDDAYEYQNESVKYGESEIVNLTAIKGEDASLLATLTIDLMNDSYPVDTITMAADEAEAEEGQTSHVFESEDIEAAARTLKVTEGYKLSDYSFEKVDVEYGKSETITLTEEKDIVRANATLTIAVYDKDAEEGAEPLASVNVTEEDGEEGTLCIFTVDRIKDEAAKIELPENYILDKSSLPTENVEVVYGSSDTVKLTASKEQAKATLEIKVYDAAKMPEESDEDASMPEPVYETSIEKTGNKGEPCEFTADEIKNAVDAEELAEKGYTLDEDSIPEKVDTTFGAEEAAIAELTAEENPKGKGHRYVKFDETYYTKDGEAWQTGTCYSCIDCGHAFEVDEDSTVEDNLRSNDKVLEPEEVEAYASKPEKVWTWSTDRTEASRYLVPTELMDHKFDSVWENPVWSSREVATVEGDCTTGKFTATLSDGTTETETITAGKHSYLNQEEKDDAGQVTQEAAVQWTWEEGLSKATVTFKCDVCGKTDTKEVAQEDMKAATTDPTCTEAGTAKYTATVTVDEVNYISSRETETDAALGHDYGEPEWNWTKNEEDGSYSAAIATFTCSRDTNHTIDVNATIESVPTDATCTEAGKVTYTATAELDGETYTDTKTVEGVALGHDYGDPVWNWTDEKDGSYSATATITCSRDENHTVSENAEVTSVTTEPTCTEAGKVIYTATAELNGETCTDTKEVVIEALGHNYGDPVWTWTEDYSGATAAFTCKNDAGHTETKTATVTSESTDATCTKAGTVTYTATVELEGKEYTDTQTVEGQALGHDYGEPEWNWTEQDDGSYSADTATFTCKRDKTHKVSVEAEVTSVTTEPTCTEAGKVIYTATAKLDNNTYTDTKEVAIEALGHDYGDPVWTWTEDYSEATATFTCKNDAGHTETKTATVTKESTDATCTKAGTVTYTATVELEGKEYTDSKSVEGQALGHDYGEPEWNWTEEDDGSYSADTATFTCKRDASHTETVPATVTSVTTEATCTEAGKVTYTAAAELEGKTYTATKDKEIPAKGHQYKDGVCTVCGEEEPSVDAPVISSVFSRDQNRVKVTWGIVDGADGYEVFRATNPEAETLSTDSADDAADKWYRVKSMGEGAKSSVADFTLSDGTSIAYNNVGLTVGQTYYYKVRAYKIKSGADASDESSRLYSEFSEVQYMPAAVVFDNVYSNSTERIRLLWNEVGGSHGYQIWRAEDGGEFKIVKTIGDKNNTLTDNQGATTAYSNTGLEAGKTYTYKMRAFIIPQDGKKVFGAYSDEIKVAVMPKTPTLKVSSSKAERADLTWNTVNGAAGYQVWMSTSKDSGYSIIKSITDGKATSYTKYDLKSGKTYYFKLRAYTEVNGKKTFGAYTDPISVKVK